MPEREPIGQEPEKSGGPEPSSVPDPEAELRALEFQFALGAEQLAAEKAVQANRKDTPKNMRRVLDLRTDIVTDPDAAAHLAERHNAHVQSREIAAQAFAIYQGLKRASASGQATGADVAEARAYFDRLRVHARTSGLFVYEYSEDLERERIEGTYEDGTPKYLIVESSGRHPDESHPRHKDVSAGADAQFKLPQADDHAESIIELPTRRKSRGSRDQLYDEDVVRVIKRFPHSVAVLDDIASDPDMGRISLAKAAMNRGIHDIVHDLNARRGEFPIERIAAEIVSVQGIVLKNGKIVRLQSDLQIAPILNDRSAALFDHFDSPDCESFQTAWIRRGTRVPVDHPEVSHILVDWHVKTARLKPS